MYFNRLLVSSFSGKYFVSGFVKCIVCQFQRLPIKFLLLKSLELVLKEVLFAFKVIQLLLIGHGLE